MTAGCAFQYGLPTSSRRCAGRASRSVRQGRWPPARRSACCSPSSSGGAADRWGERRILGGGLFVAGLLLLAAAHARGTPALAALLVLAGAAGASVHASSGRLILGWFAQHEQGLAMGVRQTAQPLGVAVAALALLGAGGRWPCGGLPLPRVALPGGGRSGRRRGTGSPAAGRAGSGRGALAVPHPGAVAAARRRRAAGGPAVRRGDVLPRLPGGCARVGRPRGRPAAGRGAVRRGCRPARRRPLVRPGAQPGCGRCARWRC